MMVKDEADVIEHTITHLRANVDDILILDNGSTDGTREILDRLGQPWEDDPIVGYFQSDKTTRLARAAEGRGHAWVLPCDADEIWYAPDRRPIKDWLNGIAPDVMVVRGDLYNHLPTTADDLTDSNPFTRIGWRQRDHAPMGKVCCRTGGGIKIGMGNHTSTFDGYGLTVGGLVLRHFSWRSPDQYLRKIRNGIAAYAATDMDESIGAHWRMFEGAVDEAIRAHYERWFCIDKPENDQSLIFDPAPTDTETKLGET